MNEDELKKNLSFQRANEIFKKTLKEKKITILAWAPLTNLAKFIQQNKENASLKNNISEIIWMGGSFKGREHNLSSDVDAAEIVFKSKIPLTLIPSEITHQFIIYSYELSKLKNNEITKFLKLRLEEWLDFVKNNKDEFPFEFPENGTFMHDVLTVVALVRPDLFEFETISVKIESEKLKKHSKGKEVKVCTNFKRKEVKQLLFSTLMRSM